MVTDKEIKHYKKRVLPAICKPDSVYYVQSSLLTPVETFITDFNGIPYALKDLQGSGLNIVNNDGSITVVLQGISTTIKISTTLQNLINSSLQPNDNVSQLVNDKSYFENILEKLSAEAIPSYTPIAIYNNLAYKLDASNLSHQFTFAGFSTNGTSLGQLCRIQQIGELTLQGWGLTPNKQYLAGTSGAIVLDNISLNNFTKVIGYATTTNTMQIIKDFSPVNKNNDFTTTN